LIYITKTSKFHKSLLALSAISMLFAGEAYAQVDAGALQQGLTAATFAITFGFA
jgi:hypothetical protein